MIVVHVAEGWCSRVPLRQEQLQSVDQLAGYRTRGVMKLVCGLTLRSCIVRRRGLSGYTAHGKQVVQVPQEALRRLRRIRVVFDFPETSQLVSLWHLRMSVDQQTSLCFHWTVGQQSFRAE